MASVTQDLQAQLDAGNSIRLSDNGTQLDWPLFVSKPGVRIGGERNRKLRAPVDLSKSGYGLVPGFPRKGLITAGHLPASGGLRTCNDVHAFARGTDYDLGPPPSGWPGIGRFELNVTAALHSPNTWDSLPLLGLCGDQYWLGGPVRPAPWAVHFEQGKLVLSFVTGEGAGQVKRVFTAPWPTSRKDLPKLVVVINFDNHAEGTRGVRILDGTDLPVDDSQAGPGWAPGLRFSENNEYPFKVGRLDAYMLSDRGLVTPYDATFKSVVFQCSIPGAASWNASINFGRPPLDSAGQPEYPMVAAPSRGGNGTRHLFLVHAAQGGAASDAANVFDVAVEDVEFLGFSGSPVVMLGRAQGGTGTSFNRCRFVGGSAALDCFMMSTMYPLTLRDCNLYLQEVRNLCLLWASRLFVDNCPTEGGRDSRECFRVMGGGGTVEGMIVTPRTAGSKRVCVQSGGKWRWRDLNVNYEGQAFIPPVLEFSTHPHLEVDWHDQSCEVANCQPGGQPGHNAGPQVVVTRLCPVVPQPTPRRPTVVVANQDYRAREVSLAAGVDAAQVDVVKVGEDLVVPPNPGGD